MDEPEYRPHMFSLAETALLLGISKSYLTTLENEHSMYARRNDRGTRVYTAADIAILRAMGVGSRPRRLRSISGAMSETGLFSFGREPHKDSMYAERHAKAARPLERQELERLQSIRERQRQRWASEWEEYSQESSPELHEAPESIGPTRTPPDAGEGTQTGARRPWWRRVFGR